MVKSSISTLIALSLFIIGIVIGYTLKESKPGKSEVRIDTFWTEIPPITKWQEGKTITDTVEVEDTAKTNYYRRYADSIAQNAQLLAYKMMPKHWYYEDSVQRSKHIFYPDREEHEDSIGYKSRKEKTIVKDSSTTIVREPTFWENLSKYGIGFLIGYGTGKTL